MLPAPRGGPVIHPGVIDSGRYRMAAPSCSLAAGVRCMRTDGERLAVVRAHIWRSERKRCMRAAGRRLSSAVDDAIGEQPRGRKPEPRGGAARFSENTLRYTRPPLSGERIVTRRPDASPPMKPTLRGRPALIVAAGTVKEDWPPSAASFKNARPAITGGRGANALLEAGLTGQT